MKKIALSSALSFGLFALILSVGTVLRFYDFQSTGLEVDEASNWFLAKSIYETGMPFLKPELHQAPQVFLFNSPTGYFLMAGWFNLTGPTIDSARVLSILASLIVLMLVYVVLLNWGHVVALLGTLFIALDGWIVLINRMNYLENVQMIFIVLGMWGFIKAHQKGSIRLYILTGVLLGLAIVYKHPGIFVILVVTANLVLARKDFKGYLALYASIALVVAIYLLGMYLLYGWVYFTQQIIWFDRLFGIVPSTGQNIGVIEAAGLIVDKYWVFATTIITLLLGGVYVVWQYLYRLVKKMPSSDIDVVLLSWAFGGIAFAVISRLNTPHYMVLWLVPLYIYLAVSITKLTSIRWKITVPAVVAVFILVSPLTWNYRFIQFKGDTLRDSAAYLNSLHTTAVVVTDPFLAVLIQNPT